MSKTTVEEPLDSKMYMVRIDKKFKSYFLAGIHGRETWWHSSSESWGSYRGCTRRGWSRRRGQRRAPPSMKDNDKLWYKQTIDSRNNENYQECFEDWQRGWACHLHLNRAWAHPDNQTTWENLRQLWEKFETTSWYMILEIVSPNNFKQLDTTLRNFWNNILINDLCNCLTRNRMKLAKVEMLDSTIQGNIQVVLFWCTNVSNNAIM